MNRKPIIIFAFLFILIGLFVVSCDKERIVQTTEYVHEIEYRDAPPDTIFKLDTVYKFDSSSTTIFDTVVINAPGNDTTFITITDSIIVFDTITQIINNYDTVIISDTINTIQYVYDTITVTDTVQINQNSANEFLAFTALQYYSDDFVIEATTASYGLTSGYIFYLSAFQHSTTKLSPTVYDIYGYIDFWSPNWADFYAYEYFWRMTYTGGDPADPLNWQISDPPAKSSTHSPGLQIKQKTDYENLIK